MTNDINEVMKKMTGDVKHDAELISAIPEDQKRAFMDEMEAAARILRKQYNPSDETAIVEVSADILQAYAQVAKLSAVVQVLLSDPFLKARYEGAFGSPAYNTIKSRLALIGYHTSTLADDFISIMYGAQNNG